MSRTCLNLKKIGIKKVWMECASKSEKLEVSDYKETWLEKCVEQTLMAKIRFDKDKQADSDRIKLKSLLMATS